jgi:hypothetical protein
MGQKPLRDGGRGGWPRGGGQPDITGARRTLAQSGLACVNGGWTFGVTSRHVFGLSPSHVAR